jgi:sulfite exporter TauE/SafE
MEATIVASALLLGLAGAPHCTAMCAAPCAALVGPRSSLGALAAFHATRATGYAAAGALAAGGLAGLSAVAQAAPMLRPLWALVHAALLVLGLWLLWKGRQPALLARIGRGGGPALAAAGGWRLVGMPSAPSHPGGSAPVRAAAAGSVWFMWPCGLLQSALLVAALSSSAAGGAAAMLAFAVASSAGLVLAPLLWRRLGRAGGNDAERWALRSAGLLMAAMSGWALTAGVWHQVAAYCATL